MSAIHTHLKKFSMFYSASTTQHFLKKCYQNNGFTDAEQKSYENCYRFIYFLEHGTLHYSQAALAPLALQPTLLFYGLAHLIKACILTINPNYPEKTTMLAHGVSTRKRKKQQYNFFEDEIKCQRNGLLPIMAENMFQIKNLEGTKIAMESLLALIPELNKLFTYICNKTTFLKLQPKGNNKYELDKVVLDFYHMTENRFITFLQSKCSFPITIEHESTNNQLFIPLTFESTFTSWSSPFKYHLSKESLYLPTTKSDLITVPEVIIHYLLLYNLSMIARYETEWWSELIKMMPNQDFPFIQAFLDISINKGPFLIFEYLISMFNN